MKNLIPFLAVVLMAFACASKPDQDPICDPEAVRDAASRGEQGGPHDIDGDGYVSLVDVSLCLDLLK